MGELMRHADAALYRAKAAGKNTYSFFAKSSPERAPRKVDVERELSEALDAGRFSLAFQPQVEIGQGIISGYETLLRWDALDGSQASARDFLPMLDETGDIVRVGKWVLRQTCVEAMRWDRPGGRFSVNVSAREFADPGFVEAVRSALTVYGAHEGQLEIELSESVLMGNSADARTKLPELVALGVSIAIDDYGVGRSSLAELAELPITTLKLHESLVRNLSHARCRAALNAVVAAGQALGWSVVAKDVETPAQLAILREIGCPHAQGLLLGSPGTAMSWRTKEEDFSGQILAAVPKRLLV